MDDTLYVDDVLGARPSFRDRAREASTLARQTENARRADEENDLVIAACEWLRDVAQCSPAEIEDIEFTRGPYSSDGTERQVVFELDGVKFRARFKRIKSTEIKSDGGLHNTTIWEHELEMRASRPGNSSTWVEVKTLADVGAVIW